MYAIIETGGKQFRVAEGDIIDIELLKEAEKSNISFTDVKLFHDGEKIVVGSPHVDGCTVQGELLEEIKGPKVMSFKYKKRKSSHRRVGHRQRFNRVKITGITQGKEK
ncbi:MAG: 50S ribosomal protein L21 [Chlamydiae bacterium]|nr:50S ribosomal protein L21 [Chlamydiota bacterium]